MTTDLRLIEKGFPCHQVGADRTGSSGTAIPRHRIPLAAGHRDAVALTVLHSCRLLSLIPIDYLTAVTPALLLHRRGGKQNLANLTPAALAASR